MGDKEANGTIVQRFKAGDMTPREGDGSEEVNRWAANWPAKLPPFQHTAAHTRAQWVSSHHLQSRSTAAQLGRLVPSVQYIAEET